MVNHATLAGSEIKQVLAEAKNGKRKLTGRQIRALTNAYEVLSNQE